MKNERLFEALEKIDEELIDEAAPGNKPPKKKAKTATWVKWGAMAACALVIVGVGIPHYNKYGGKPEEPMLEGNISDVTSNEGAIAAKGVELRIHIEKLNSDGFSGRIVDGTELFKEGEHIKVVLLGHAYVVNHDGQVLEYDEEDSNIEELELVVGNDVNVMFGAEIYERIGEDSLLVYAYRVDTNDDMNYSIATDNEPMVELTLEEAVSNAKFGNLFPATMLDGYVLQDAVAVLNDTVLVANFYNEALGDEMTIRIASQEWFYNQKKDLVQNTVMYREKDGASYIYIAGGENIVQYTFSKTDIADNEKFYDMVYSAAYFSECIDYPDIDVNE